MFTCFFFVCFFFSIYTQVYNSFIKVKGVTRANITLRRLAAWKAACKAVDVEEFVAHMEGSLNDNIRPGTLNVVDESLPKATHRESLINRELQMIPRKPSNMGFLIYQCVCKFDLTGLPCSFGFATVGLTNRMSPAEAFLNLVRKRFTADKHTHITIIADSAFSSTDIRCLVGLNATMTEGRGIDMTLSVNHTWEKKLWAAISYN